MTHSLDRLNERERELLRLLAYGHTVKTIAKSLGLSVNTINERLRSARRKTDAPSSRELARIMVSLENGAAQDDSHKFLGIESPQSSEHQSHQRGLAAGARPTSRVWKMGLASAFVVAAGLFAYGTSIPVQVGAVSQPAEQPSYLSFTGAQYQAACVSSDVRDKGYCAGLLINQMMRHGQTDYQLCRPNGHADSSRWSAIARESAPAIARVSVSANMQPADVALAALKETYPCRTDAERDASVLSRTLPVWVALERGGERVAVGADERFVVEITTGDGQPVSRFSNIGTGAYVNEAVIGMGIVGRYLPRTGQSARIFKITGTIYGPDGSVVSRANPVTLSLAPDLPSELRPTLSFST